MSGTVYNALPTWTNSQAGSSTDNLFVRLNTITGLFDGTTGHLHSGVNGDGPIIPGSNIGNVPFEGIFNQGTLLTGVTGSSWDVSTQLSGKSPSTSQTVLGVVVNTPYNRAILRDTNGQEFVDGGGNQVYGRVTNSGPTWTLSFYSLVSGIETSYSFASSTTIDWYYQELYNPMVSTPVYNPFAFTPSDNATADVLDATTSQKGKVLLSSSAPGIIASTGSAGTANATVANADHTHEGVHALFRFGDVTAYKGDVTLKAGTGISLVDDSGAIRIDNSATNTPQVENRIVSSGEAVAKSLTLSMTPNDVNKVVLDIISVGPQSRLSDFTVSGNVLSWGGLGMDSLPIEAGDEFRIIYWS